MATSTDEPSTEPVELLGPQSWLSGTSTEESLERDASRLPTALVIAAFAVVVVAFALMSRPSPSTEDGAGEPDGVRPAVTTAPGPGGDDDDSTASTERDPASERLAMRDIPPFDGNVPESLPGVLSGLDEHGSFIIIDRSTAEPEEVAFGPRVVPTGGDPPASLLALPGSSPVPLDGAVEVDGSLLYSSASGVRRQIDLERLVPGWRFGAVVVVAEVAGEVVVTSTGGAGEGEWVLPRSSAVVVGPWGDGLLVSQANQLWLLGPTGEPTLVSSDQVLAYDGRHLVLLACGRPAQCQLSVGPPDNPGLRTIALPQSLAGLTLGDWADSLAISPDGSRLAASVDHGALSLPVMVDLESGETTTLADGMNRQAPVAWSPDGQWLAYVYTDDVMVWSLADNRSWRITLDRRLESLIWR